jgi:hypothetical protein
MAGKIHPNGPPIAVNGDGQAAQESRRSSMRGLAPVGGSRSCMRQIRTLYVFALVALTLALALAVTLT